MIHYGNELEIEKTKLKKDLGIIVCDELKCAGHVDRMVEKTNLILSKLKRTSVSRYLGLWKDLYVFLVKSHLVYSVQAWMSHLEGDIDRVDKNNKKLDVKTDIIFRISVKI